MADSLEQPGFIDLLKQLTSSKATTKTDSDAIGMGMDPSSPDILKEIAATITKIKEGGTMPDEATSNRMGAALKSHLDYNSNLNLLQKLNKAYTEKYGAGTPK